MKLWLLCGGPSAEHEVSLSSGKVVCERMNLAGRRVRPVVVTRQNRWIISDRELTGESVADREWIGEFFATATAPGSPLEQQAVSVGHALARMVDEQVDCVLPIFHGEFGEDGRLQGMLDTAEIPYIGSGVLASAVALNKAVSIATFARAGLKVARSVRVTRRDFYAAAHRVPTSAAPPELGPLDPEPEALPRAVRDLRLPVFVKPVRGGSSLGVTLVKDVAAYPVALRKALELDTEALVEEKIEGCEVSCGVLDIVRDGQVVSTALPPTLIQPLEAEFFDYDAKYVPGKSRDTTPAPLPQETVARIQVTALAAHRALTCEGMSRTDMIVSTEPGAEPVILELQTIPGLTPTSLLPQQCAAVGIDFPAFIDTLIDHALYRAQSRGPKA